MTDPSELVIAGQGVLFFDALPSTNDHAKALAADGAADGAVIWASRQTAGRGRRGREWVSAPGNLFVSVILRPAVPPAKAAELTFVASLAVADAVVALLPGGASVACKWPNDVLVNGAKAAGILLESDVAANGDVAWLVVGVGINLAGHPADVERPAMSLAGAGGEKVTPERALALFLPALQNRYQQWRTAGFSAIRNAWLERAVGLGQPIIVRLARDTLHGVFHGLDADGVLLLDPGDGRPLQRVAAGDVFFAGEATS